MLSIVIPSNFLVRSMKSMIACLQSAKWVSKSSNVFDTMVPKLLMILLTTGISKKAFTHSETFVITLAIISPSLFIHSVILSCSTIQSRKPLIASPMLAVTSRMFKFIAERTDCRSLKAKLRAPPAILRTISSAAKRPSKVLLNSSAFAVALSSIPLENL